MRLPFLHIPRQSAILLLAATILIITIIHLAGFLILNKQNAELYQTILNTLRSSAAQAQPTMAPEKEIDVTTILASNPRVSNILAYRLRRDPQLSNHTDFIKKLHSAVLDDNTRKVAFEQLKDAGATRSELLSIDSDTYLFRDKWVVTITPGSYFYERPFSDVLFFNEAFTFPPCTEGFEPYVAQLSTNAEVSVDIIQDSTYALYGHRAIAKDKNGDVILDNLTDRIMIDAGCTPMESEEDADLQDS
ncbi:TPA: hypothetical protein JG825_003497 [Vibrio parahaemolyticus]|uniref:hypothetical protein n=1 Tax=Vibrio owensii TaxID=696485 RepID=UPI0018F1D073|nr:MULTISPECIES: hypothetical protein [Vibrio harveyi group]UPR19041.1 hypothetical protein H9J99_26195 [Vibrio parahaemolyticus]HAV1520178.1 hypothetical protein [Vibrio parahaemolyticus]HAV1539144.1 hypothetical protein [Vibrio parahaemolyticus]